MCVFVFLLLVLGFLLLLCFVFHFLGICRNKFIKSAVFLHWENKPTRYYQIILNFISTILGEVFVCRSLCSDFNRSERKKQNNNQPNKLGELYEFLSAEIPLSFLYSLPSFFSSLLPSLLASLLPSCLPSLIPSSLPLPFPPSLPAPTATPQGDGCLSVAQCIKQN